MTRRLLLLTAASLALWVLLALPARWYFRAHGGPGSAEAAVAYSGVAVALCLVPTAGTLVWAGWAARRSGEQQLAMVLGGTGVRMAVVLLGALLLYQNVDYFRLHPGFWAWVLVFYLSTLALETALLTSARAAEARQPGVG